MNFDPSEEQVMLADMVGKLFADHAKNNSSSDAWNDYLEYGLIGLPFADQQGGLGGGPAETMLVMEAVGRTLARAPYWQSVMLAGRVLALADRAELGELLSSGARHALCLHEPGQRYRWEAPRTCAEWSGNGWTLSGSKISVLDADEKCGLIVPVSMGEVLGLLFVPAGTSGVTFDIQPTPDGRHAANVTFNDVALPEDAMIGDAARNSALLCEVIDGAVLASCSEAIGAMERLLELTVDYCNIREQFGVAIGTFQAVQHRAADMLIAIERARSITIYAASMMDALPERRSVAVSAAKALVNQSSRLVGQQAIQLHGGMGLASECAAGAYFQRLTVLETILGDTDHHLAVVERGGGLLAD